MLTASPSGADLDSLRAFHEQLLAQHLAAHPGTTPRAIAAGHAAIANLDNDLASLHADDQRSGLTLPEYLAFYDALNRAPFFATQVRAERHAQQFFAALADAGGAPFNQRNWLDALAAAHTDCPGFLTQMAERGDGFQQLTARYRQRRDAQGPLIAADISGLSHKPLYKLTASIDTFHGPLQKSDGQWVRIVDLQTEVYLDAPRVNTQSKVSSVRLDSETGLGEPTIPS